MAAKQHGSNRSVGGISVLEDTGESMGHRIAPVYVSGALKSRRSDTRSLERHLEGKPCRMGP